jgi:hypothetical protein
MNIIKITSMVAVSVIATLAVAAIMGFQLSEITAQETTRPQYLNVEGVEITGVFKFREAEELVPLQVFTQTSGYQRAKPAIFTVQKIVGNTPYLHKHADESFFYRSSQDEKQNWNPFDVEIVLATGPYAKRIVTYSKCFIDDYQLTTLRDNEEGYTNKGFANVENYVIECRAMEFQNPSLQELEMTRDDQKATTTSTLDLKEPFTTWSDHFKYQKTGSLQPTQ